MGLLDGTYGEDRDTDTEVRIGHFKRGLRDFFFFSAAIVTVFLLTLPSRSAPPLHFTRTFLGKLRPRPMLRGIITNLECQEDRVSSFLN